MYCYLLQLERIFWCRINGNRFQKTYYGQGFFFWKMGAQKSVIERHPAFTTSSFDTSFVYLGDKLNFRPPFFLGLFLCRLDLSLSCLMILQSTFSCIVFIEWYGFHSFFCNFSMYYTCILSFPVNESFECHSYTVVYLFFGSKKLSSRKMFPEIRCKFEHFWLL